jgi:hypothetical protein
MLMLVIFMKLFLLDILEFGTATLGLHCIAVGGSSKLLIAGQELEVIATPVCAPPKVAFYWN